MGPACTHLCAGSTRPHALSYGNQHCRNLSSLRHQFNPDNLHGTSTPSMNSYSLVPYTTPATQSWNSFNCYAGLGNMFSPIPQQFDESNLRDPVNQTYGTSLHNPATPLTSAQARSLLRKRPGVGITFETWRNLTDQVTECLDLFLYDPKCKHIVSGVRQDFSQGSHVRMLFAGNSNRIRTTLLIDGRINPTMMTPRLREPDVEEYH